MNKQVSNEPAMKFGLRAAAKLGFSWTSAGVLVAGIGQVLVLAVLGRTLTPAEFGLANTALLVFAFGANIFEGGAGINIAQRQSLSADDIAAACQVSLLFSIVMMVGLLFLRDPISSFFSAPDLATPLVVVAFTLLLGGFAGPNEAILFHQRKYKTAVVIKVIAFSLGYPLITIALALQDFGLMALIYGHFAAYLIASLLMLGITGAKAFTHRTNRLLFASHFRATSLLSAGRLATYVSNQADKVIIGKVIGMEALGYYGRAHQIMMLPNKVFMQVVTRVATPLFSSIQDQKRRVAAAYMSALRVSLALLAPAVVMLSLYSDRVVRILMGPGWETTAVILSILAPAGAFQLLYKIPLLVLYSQELGKQTTLSQTVYAALFVSSVLLAVSSGMTTVAIVVAALTFLNYVFLTAQIVMRLGISLSEIVRSHVLGIWPALVFLPFAWFMSQVPPESIHWVMPFTATCLLTLILPVLSLRTRSSRLLKKA